MFSVEVKFEHGAVALGHYPVSKSGLVAFKKGDPPRLPQIILFSNECINIGGIGLA